MSWEIFVKDVTARIRDVRIERGITVSELAEAAELDTETLTRMENGEGCVTLDKLLMIAGLLGISLTDTLDEVWKAAKDRVEDREL